MVLKYLYWRTLRNTHLVVFKRTMFYLAIQHPDGRWGIYYGQELLATVACKQTCDSLISCLNSQKKNKSSEE